MSPFYTLNYLMNPHFFLFRSPLILIAILIWSFVWKGIVLWKSARNGQTIWFVALLLINTLGILEIVYYVFFSKPVSIGVKKKLKGK